MNNYILINSYIRSGGSLVARMLDGHPDLRVLPVEMSYGKRKTVFPDFGKKAHSAEEFAKEIDLERSFQKLDEKGVITKDPYGKQKIDFSYNELINELNKTTKDNEFTLGEGVNLISVDFFKSWKNYFARDLLHKEEHELVYVNHLSAACFADCSVYLDAFPKSTIIQTVRNPFAWYASVKTHIGIPDNHQVFLECAMLLWLESTIRGIIAKKYKKNDYLFLRYEDIIFDAETTLTQICKDLNIEFHEILLQPTINGLKWNGNSSYGRQEGLDKRSLSQWRKLLTRAEVEKIINITQELSEILGYSDSSTLNEINWNVNVFYSSYLGLSISLCAESDYERQKLESMRMSMIMHLIFHECLMRNVGSRYQEVSILSRLKNRLFRNRNKQFR